MGTQSAIVQHGAAGGPTTPMNPILNLAPILVPLLIMYVLLFRPMQKERKEHRRMVDNLKPGDRVLTQGGIYGTVVNLKGGVVQVRIADNVKVEIARSAITQVIVENTNGSAVTAGGDRVS